MSIFRETLQKDIKTSLENRQKAMTGRSTGDIQYLNSRNVWIRMASSVDVNGTSTLAKQYVLQGGSLYNTNINTSFGRISKKTLRSGIVEKFTDGGAYNISGSNSPYRLGIRPMPGITSVEIKSKSAYGSLREATVNFQCWDIAQLDDLELLYMRPGYTVLLEWGWAPYLDTNGKYEPTFTDFYTDTILDAKQKDRTQIFKDLFNKCTKHGGNYDAIFGYVKNYNWSARADGGYDCSTTIITTGEVIESIKVNYVRKDLERFKMYDTGSKGNGFLNSLFSGSAQGNTPSAKFAEHYQKNTLAGVWAELNYKLKDSYATLSPLGSAIVGNKTAPGVGDKYNILEFKGLTNYGDFNSFIEPGSPLKTFITLEAAFDVINKFILTEAKGDNQSLIKLSTKVGGVGSANLQCVAHPTQISIDPTVCMIKSPLWYKEISPKITTTTSGAAATVNTEADTIAQELINASVDRGGNNEVIEDDFLTSIKKIKNSILFTVIDNIFKNGKLTDGTPTGTFNYPRGSANGEGLAGLIYEQFVKEGADTKTIGPLKNYKQYTRKLVSLYYIYLMQKHLATAGVPLEVQVTLTGRTSSPLTTILANRNPSLYFENISEITTPSSRVVFDSEAKTSYKETIYDLNGDIGAITIGTLTQAQQTAAAIVLNTAEAVGIIGQMEKLTQEFFVKSYPPNLPAPPQDCIDAELGYIGNIYVSLDYLYRQSLNTSLEASDTKEKNEINLYSYVKGVMSGIQVSIGNLNNFEIHVDPIDNNVARVIDINYTERSAPPPLFGLEVHNLNSIVRSYNLQSQIFPNQSAIIAIGSQAQGGGQGAIQNKTMVSFNNGITDRILGDKTDPDDKAPTLKDLAVLLSSIIVLYATFGATIPPGQTNNINFSEAISRAKNALRDLIVYFQIKDDSPSANRNILPFKFSFDMDGIGGLVIGNLFKIKPDDVIPKGYRGGTAGVGVDLVQTITGISHTLQNNDWVTKVDALNIILDRSPGCLDVSNLGILIKDAVDVIINSGLGLGLPTGGGGGTIVTGGVCGGADTNTVDTVYPRSVRYQNGPASVIVLPTNPPTVSINLSTLSLVSFIQTIVTPLQYVKAAERVINKLALGASNDNKKKILISAFAISRKEQRGPNNGFKGFNNNISGIESSGFKVYSASEVDGKVQAREGGTGILKDYYSFTSLDAGLVPLISSIMERNMFATGGTEGEWAWRWFRDWNGYGGRKKPNYISDCDIINNTMPLFTEASNAVLPLTIF